MDAAERVRALIEPLMTDDLELYDVEFASGILRVTIDRPGGVDVDAIGDISHQVSRLLDEQDPVPGSQYLLEVSSPGVERRLRTPAHFTAQIGNRVRVKLNAKVEGARRFDATLISADDSDVTFEIDGDSPTSVQIPYSTIEHARILFNWDAALKGREAGAHDDKSNDEKASTR